MYVAIFLELTFNKKKKWCTVANANESFSKLMLTEDCTGTLAYHCIFLLALGTI